MRTLFGYFRSSAAYRVRIALGLKGLAYDYKAINLKPGEDEQRSPDYLAMNPQGRVPFLVDGEVNLSQSPAILEYLEEAYPEAALLPEGVADRAYVRQLSALVACDIHPLNNLSVLKWLKGELGADEAAVNKWYHHWILEGFAAYEALLGTSGLSGRFSFGDAPTLADIYLIPQVWNANRFKVPLEAFPRINAIVDACNSLEAFADAAPEKQPDCPAA
ncbi:maleylacetoacetate isomerase [Kordiimonas marina]|uniref:maleylacetoacetate isomerase n=1 Tax=Kordiimonas marina TaxID=2872312 RepID=UPI001FF440DF|nr:maleylacetoacetate isomerase [Kordiimonas marina]MCJ9429063.1 maleylacetoacetate isomerase [Kordiimonas marina]